MSRWPRASILLGLLLLPAVADARRNQGENPHPGRNGALTEAEREVATIAWKYFENNFQKTTCMINAVDNYPSATMWDTASYIGAMVSARELGVLIEPVFDENMSCLLDTLAKIPLFRGELPNKAYDTRTATMADYGNNPGEIGYSALDIGRLLIWFRILEERYPQLSPRIRAVIDRWSFCNVLDSCGTMYGAMPTKEGVLSLQEGRLGYEEYAAKGYQLWGFATKEASKLEPYEVIGINGIDIPHDARDPRILGAHTYVVTESYALDGLELNWDEAEDRRSADLVHTDEVVAKYAQQVYRVQEARHASTGILTARTEHQLDVEPWFVYDTVYSDGYSWNTITDEGRYLPASAAVSLKAAFSLWALWETPYTQLLFTSMAGKFDPQRGFYEGVYEQSGANINTFTANNNGIILEALFYKVKGKILRFSEKSVEPWKGASPEVARERCQLATNQRSSCGPAATR